MTTTESVFTIINPPDLGEPRGWNNGMLGPSGGRVLLVAGQTATDASGSVVSGDFVAQFRQALARSVAIVAAAGGGPESIGRLTIYVTDMAAYRGRLEEIGPAYRDVMGRHFPAMALVAVSALVDPEAQVEIEATAVLPDEPSTETLSDQERT